MPYYGHGRTRRGPSPPMEAAPSVRGDWRSASIWVADVSFCMRLQSSIWMLPAFSTTTKNLLIHSRYMGSTAVMPR